MLSKSSDPTCELQKLSPGSAPRRVQVVDFIDKHATGAAEGRRRGRWPDLLPLVEAIIRRNIEARPSRSIRAAVRAADGAPEGPRSILSYTRVDACEPVRYAAVRGDYAAETDELAHVAAAVADRDSQLPGREEERERGEADLGVSAVEDVGSGTNVSGSEGGGETNGTVSQVRSQLEAIPRVSAGRSPQLQEFAEQRAFVLVVQLVDKHAARAAGCKVL